MKGADVKCPKCGAGVVDIAPDYEFDPNAIFGRQVAVESHSIATCANGHGMWITANAHRDGQPTTFTVEPVREASQR